LNHQNSESNTIKFYPTTTKIHYDTFAKRYKSYDIIIPRLDRGIQWLQELSGFPDPWPGPGIKIKLFIILVSEKLQIYDNRPCHARAGKPGNDF
jgi:hypothetical protein